MLTRLMIIKSLIAKKEHNENLLDVNREIGTPDPSDGSNSTSPRMLEFDKAYVGLRRDNYYYPRYVRSYSISEGTVEVTTAASNEYGVAFPIRVDAGEQYTVNATSTDNLIGVGFYNENWNFLSSVQSSSLPYTFTAPNNAYCATIVFRSISASVTSTYTNIVVKRMKGE